MALCQHCGAHILSKHETVTCLGDCGEVVHANCPATDRGCGLANVAIPCFGCQKVVRLKEMKASTAVSVVVSGFPLDWYAHWQTADEHHCQTGPMDHGTVQAGKTVVQVHDGKSFLVV